jgi:hypothetical protein
MFEITAILLGIPEARKLGSELLSAPVDNTLVGEQSSLLLIYQLILANLSFWFRKGMERARKI